jgi:hypothetical protein
LGDPEEAAETLLYGAGIGALFGLAGPAAKQIKKGAEAGIDYAAEAVKNKIPGIAEAGGVRPWLAEQAQAFSEKEAVKAFSPLKKYSKKVYGIGEDEIARVAKQFDLMPKFPQTAEQVFENVEKARLAEGKAIGSALEAAGSSELVDTRGVLGAVQSVTDELETKYGKTAIRKAAARLTREADALIEAYPNGMSIEDLHKTTAAIGRDIPDVMKSDLLREALGAFRSRINDAMLGQMERNIIEAGGDAGGALAAFKQHRKNYRSLALLSDVTEDNIARGLANRSHSVTDYGANVIGGIVGAAMGHPAAGALVGGMANKFGRIYGNRYLSEGAEMLAKWLASPAARTPLNDAGILATEQAQKFFGDRLDEVAPVLAGESRLARAFDMLEPAALSSVTEFLRLYQGDKESTHAERVAKFRTLADELTSLSSDPTKMQAAVETAIKPYAGDAPNVAMAYGGKLANAVGYLQATMPKRRDIPGPFSPKTEWAPNDTEMATWARAWGAALDPVTLVQHAADGKLTSKDVEALGAMYPKLKQRIVKAVIEHATNTDATGTSYKTRMKLALLLGTPQIEPSLTTVAKMQKIFAASMPDASDKGLGGGGKPMRRKFGASWSAPTDAQRIAEK